MDSLELARKEAIEVCREAVELDQNENFISAREKYLLAVQRLAILIKKDDNEKNRQIYLSKSTDYSNRAKELDEYITSHIKTVNKKLNRLTSFESRRKEAMDEAKKAVELDDNGNFEEAIQYYQSVSEKLLELTKEETNDVYKNTYKKKASSYLERIEELRAKIFKSVPREDDPNSLYNIRLRISGYAKKAIELDRLGNLEEAYELYKKSAELLNLLSKQDDNLNNKVIYKRKGVEYCSRAIEIQKIIGERNQNFLNFQNNVQNNNFQNFQIQNNFQNFQIQNNPSVFSFDETGSLNNSLRSSLINDLGNFDTKPSKSLGGSFLNFNDETGILGSENREFKNSSGMLGEPENKNYFYNIKDSSQLPNSSPEKLKFKSSISSSISSSLINENLAEEFKNAKLEVEYTGSIGRRSVPYGIDDF